MNPKRCPPDSPAAMHTLAMGVLAAGALACSLIVEHRNEQCNSDADCARFAGAVCNLADGVCVPASSGPGGGDGAVAPEDCAAPDKPLVEIIGDITESYTLKCDKDYLLKGQVNVTAGATLIIEKGTTIRGETNPQVPAVLVVHPGSRLIAVGTKDEPIESGLDVRAPETAPGVSSSIFFNLVNHFAFAEESGGTGILADDDGGFDEIEFLSDLARKNRDTDPGIERCFHPSALVFGPAKPLTKDAATPPGDFFDSSAAFVGAFRDAGDTWATSGKWAVWSPR